VRRRDFLARLCGGALALTVPAPILRQVEAWVAEAPDAPCTVAELDRLLKEFFQPLPVISDTELLALFRGPLPIDVRYVESRLFFDVRPVKAREGAFLELAAREGWEPWES
jgi:hypothetical protein